MKRCPECRRDYYDDTLLYCLDDGNTLLEGPGNNEPATAKLHSVELPSEANTKIIDPTDRNLAPESLRDVSTPETSATTRKKSSPIMVGIALLLTSTAIGFAIYKFWGRSENPPQSIKIERLTTSGKVSDAAISPDGKYVVYILDEGGKRSLWTRQVATTSNVQIVSPTDAQYFGQTFSPDSNYINIVKLEKGDVAPSLYQMPVLGGVQKKLITGISASIGYSPDGKQFAFIRRRFPADDQSSLLIANADGSSERILASLKLPEKLARNPVWSSNGKSIASVAVGDSENTWKVVEVQVADGTVKPIAAQGWHDIRRIVWQQDKSGIFVLGADKVTAYFAQQIWRFPYPSGEPRRVTNDFHNYRGMSLSTDSGTFATVQSNSLSNIWVAPNGDANSAVPIKSGGNNIEGAGVGIAWTPDGRIVYDAAADGPVDIWIMNQDGSDQKQLTVGTGANLSPRVSPDGRYIVFVSEHEDRQNIWRMDLDGGNLKQLTSGNTDFRPAVSPDSKWVVYASRSSGDERLWKVSINGENAVQLTDYFATQPEVSPDGKSIACIYREGGRSPVRFAIVPFEGGKPLNIFDLPLGVDKYRWSKDSRSLTYEDTREGAANIWSYPLNNTPPVRLTNFKSEEIYNFDWSADGKHLVLVRGTTTSDVVLMRF